MLHTFLLVVQILLAAALVTVILMQRSEGGGLVSGGGSGLMSARGAGDFLTRLTAILAALFIANTIGLAVLASVDRAPRAIDTSLVAPAAPVPAALPPVPAVDGSNQAAGESARSQALPATTGGSQAAPAKDSAPVPLAQ